MAKKNAFDKIAKSASDVKKDDMPVAQVNDVIKKAVDDYVTTKARIKTDTATLATIETQLVDHVRPQQDELGYCGSHTKSMRVPGVDSTVSYVTSDRFSVPQDEKILEALKELIGTGLYDMFLNTKRTISVKKEVIDDELKLQEMADAIEKAGLKVADFFDVVDKVVAKKELDVNQYKLPKNKLEQFRTMVIQQKPAFK